MLIGCRDTVFTYGSTCCLMMKKGTSKNALDGIFLHGQAKTQFSPFLHFQSLVMIENGSTSQCRSDASIFRGALMDFMVLFCIGWNAFCLTAQSVIERPYKGKKSRPPNDIWQASLRSRERFGTSQSPKSTQASTAISCLGSPCASGAPPIHRFALFWLRTTPANGFTRHSDHYYISPTPLRNAGQTVRPRRYFSILSLLQRGGRK